MDISGYLLLLTVHLNGHRPHTLNYSYMHRSVYDHLELTTAFFVMPCL
jgi:hypothetical protein